MSSARSFHVWRWTAGGPWRVLCACSWPNVTRLKKNSNATQVGSAKSLTPANGRTVARNFGCYPPTRQVPRAAEATLLTTPWPFQNARLTRCPVLSRGAAMRRRSRSGGESAKAQRRKTGARKKGRAPRSSPVASQQTKLVQFTSELNEAYGDGRSVGLSATRHSTCGSGLTLLSKRSRGCATRTARAFIIGRPSRPIFLRASQPERPHFATLINQV